MPAAQERVRREAAAPRRRFANERLEESQRLVVIARVSADLQPAGLVVEPDPRHPEAARVDGDAAGGVQHGAGILFRTSASLIPPSIA